MRTLWVITINGDAIAVYTTAKMARQTFRNLVAHKAGDLRSNSIQLHAELDSYRERSMRSLREA